MTPARTLFAAAHLAGACLAAACLAGAAAAQSLPVVDPPPFRFMPGGRTTGFPFGYPLRDVVRYQEIHDDLRGTARTIAALALRRAPSTVTVPAFTARVGLRLSTAPHGAARITDSFAQNTGTDVAEVRATAPLSLPADAPAAPLPEFTYTIPADRPFAFGGAGPLCVELLVESHTNRTPFSFDLVQAGGAHAAAFGDGCGGTALDTTLTPTKVTHRASGLPPDAPLFFIAGLPRARELDLAPLGAPGCTSYTSLSVLVPGFAGTSGGYTLDLDPGPARPGDHYAAQVMAIEPGLNVLGAVLTDASIVLPETARRAGRTWAESLAATTGTAQPVYGLVLGLR